jgi:hypothetical protein
LKGKSRGHAIRGELRFPHHVVIAAGKIGPREQSKAEIGKVIDEGTVGGSRIGSGAVNGFGMGG